MRKAANTDWSKAEFPEPGRKRALVILPEAETSKTTVAATFTPARLEGFAQATSMRERNCALYVPRADICCWVRGRSLEAEEEGFAGSTSFGTSIRGALTVGRGAGGRVGCRGCGVPCCRIKSSIVVSFGFAGAGVGGGFGAGSIGLGAGATGLGISANSGTGSRSGS